MLGPESTRSRRGADILEVQRIAAFADGWHGGNPAGVVLCEVLPGDAVMQAVAAEVGYSETAFARAGGTTGGALRYFAPEVEVDFCGHATIALGAALALKNGDGTFPLRLNQARIVVEGRRAGELLTATLQSPPTRSGAASVELVGRTLALLGLSARELDDPDSSGDRPRGGGPPCSRLA